MKRKRKKALQQRTFPVLTNKAAASGSETTVNRLIVGLVALAAIVLAASIVRMTLQMIVHSSVNLTAIGLGYNLGWVLGGALLVLFIPLFARRWTIYIALPVCSYGAYWTFVKFTKLASAGLSETPTFYGSLLTGAAAMAFFVLFCCAVGSLIRLVRQTPGTGSGTGNATKPARAPKKARKFGLHLCFSELFPAMRPAAAYG